MEIVAFLVDFGAAKTIRTSLELPAQEPEPLARAPPGIARNSCAPSSRPWRSIPVAPTCERGWLFSCLAWLSLSLTDPVLGAVTSGRCGPIRFRDLTIGTGNDFVHDRGTSGEQHLPETMGGGLTWIDYDGYGWPDLYVANDLNINQLLRNRGDGTFEDLSLISGMGVNREGRPETGMVLAVGDVDGDRLPDLAVTNFDIETNTLYRNLGGMAFEDVSAAAGFGLPSFNQLAFGIATLDLEGDGDLDFYIANGHVFERPRRENVSYKQRDQVLLGDGDGGFEELRCAWLDERPTAARGLAVADLDNDGVGELALQENGGPFGLLGVAPREDRWLGFVLRSGTADSAGIGSLLRLSGSTGKQQMPVLAGDSYQSSGDPRIQFSVPSAWEDLRAEISWPQGSRQRYLLPPRGRYLVVYGPAEP